MFPRDVAPTEGINFSFSCSESLWLGLENLRLAGLRKELQPDVLNKRFTEFGRQAFASESRHGAGENYSQEQRLPPRSSPW